MSVQTHIQTPSRRPAGPTVLAAAMLSDGVILGVADARVECAIAGAQVTSHFIDLAERHVFLVESENSLVGAAATLGVHRFVELRQLLRGHLAVLDDRDRDAVLALATGLFTRSRRNQQSHCLAESLRLVQEALRRRLPEACDPSAVRGLCCEGIAAAGDGSFAAWGWAFDRQSPSVRLVAVSPEGLRIDATDATAWHAHGRADDMQTRSSPACRRGFFCRFDAPPGSSFIGWLFEMHSAEGAALESRAPVVLVEPEQASLAVLERVSVEPSALMQAAHPVLSAVQCGLGDARVRSVRTCGQQMLHPAVSIVVPIFEHPELVEQQYISFAADAEVRELAEIVYVLDSPWREDDFVTRASRWFDAHQMPFRLAVLERRSGFARTCNAGAKVATGADLLLMHSDVLPAGAGWLTALHRFQRKTIDAGAIGARLLAPDGAVQHDGFTLARRDERWAARSPLKGVDARLLASDVAPKRVPAVSAACLLVDRKQFIDVGGLSGQYPSGDYEDVDLCVRLSQAGRTNWILPSATLHHLEGQSRSRLLADVAAGYNAWLFSQRWGATLGVADVAKGEP